MTSEVPDELYADVMTLWEYHNMHHELRPCDVGIGLGSHDLGVATYTAELFHAGMFTCIVFSGANAPTTIERFPRGEAEHYREHAISLGVPAGSIITETRSTNTGENIEFTRKILAERDIHPSSVMLISRPYQQRRAYATCRKLWPAVDVTCASQIMSLTNYVKEIGDVDRVVNMIVGDTQRIIEYPKRGYAIPQEMPAEVNDAYLRLVSAGYTSRLI
ncbi:YdcF family protein [Acrocarpospora catenulata]|uniref:YdcF family protein n=1 Tax=Acrocarpospora catenulata TaxID=2836182 RepID=UPI0027E0DA48|nr:YdcF family protein [Acrocarpospora catenulata]